MRRFLLASRFFLASCLPHFSIFKQAISSPEILGDFYRNTRRHIPESGTLPGHHCENLKSKERRKFVNILTGYLLLTETLLRVIHYVSRLTAPLEQVAADLDEATDRSLQQRSGGNRRRGSKVWNGINCCFIDLHTKSNKRAGEPSSRRNWKFEQLNFLHRACHYWKIKLSLGISHKLQAARECTLTQCTSEDIPKW